MRAMRPRRPAPIASTGCPLVSAPWSVALLGVCVCLGLGTCLGCGEVAPKTRSSTHWLACDTDSACRNLSLGARCEAGYCVTSGDSRLALSTVLDEGFEADSLSDTAFGYETGYLLRNDEAQAYTDRTENVSLENGELVLTARAESFDAASFTSGSVDTRGRQAFTFGRFEARMRIARGRGCSNVFWLLPESPSPDVYSCDDMDNCYLGTWPAWGDVTIANVQSRDPDTLVTALNYGIWDSELSGVRHAEVIAFSALAAADAGWHVFALEWGPERMEWFVDDELVASANLTLPDLYLPEGEHPFHQPFSLKLNLALGGLDQTPVAADYPAELRIDWVKVTQWLPEE
jgi:beta-glucanase (GH16 family)